MENQFMEKLMMQLENPGLLTENAFLELLKSFFATIMAKSGVFYDVDYDYRYYRSMLEKLSPLIKPNVGVLIFECSLRLGKFDLLETLIAERVVDYSTPDLIEKIIKEKESYLVCLCMKNFTELKSADVKCVLKYFLSPPEGAEYSNYDVEKKLERQVILGKERATDDDSTEEELNWANQAWILLRMAFEDFSSAEICMHYLYSSSKFDESIFVSSLSMLDDSEVKKLIQYLGKWLKKYLKFTGEAPTGSKLCDLIPSLKLCDLVPSLNSIDKYLGRVIEQFSCLVSYSDFHDYLKSLGLGEDVRSLAEENRISCSWEVLKKFNL